MEAFDIRALDIEPRHPQVLHSSDDARLIAIQLPAGESMQEHQVHEAAFLVVVDGSVELVQGGRSTTAGGGSVVCFAPNERREIRAVEDARLGLLLTPWPGAGHPSDPAERAGTAGA